MKTNQATGETRSQQVFDFAQMNSSDEIRRRGDISAIVAIAHEGAIGVNGGLLCHMSADLKHFKEITMGHSIIMGRRTFESLPKGALPGRENIVITSNPDYEAPGAIVCNSVEDGLLAATMHGEKFIIGGASIYNAAINFVSTLHLTEIDASFPEADTSFPVLNTTEWLETWKEEHDADEKNPYPYTFRTLVRRK